MQENTSKGFVEAQADKSKEILPKNIVRDGFYSYKGDTFIVLAGKNAAKESSEDNSSERDLISNDVCKALIPIDNIPVLDHIVQQHISLMDDFKIPAALYIGAPEDLEHKIQVYSGIDTRISFVKQANPRIPGSGRIANIWRGIEEVQKQYPARKLDELYHIVMDNSNQNFHTEISTRSKLVPVTLFSSIAERIVKKGIKPLDINELHKTVIDTIKHQLDEHMLPAWIQRCRLFNKLDDRLEKYKHRIFQEVINNNLLVADDQGIGFGSLELLRDFHNFNINRNLGVYIISSDWPIQENSMRWLINSVHEHKCPSVLMPIVDEKAIYPYHEIDRDYKGPVDFRNPATQVRGWIEAPMELAKQYKYGNAMYTKPNRLLRAGLVENAFRQRKGNSSFVVPSLLYHSAKYLADIVFNREGSKGWYTGIHYPFCLNYKTLSVIGRGIGAYYLTNHVLNKEFVNDKPVLSDKIKSLKDTLTNRSTLHEVNSQISRMLGCSFILDPVPYGTAAIDMDRFREDTNGNKYYPVAEYYGLWRHTEIKRASEYLSKNQDFAGLHKVQMLGRKLN
jgi:hypothetical protein